MASSKLPRIEPVDVEQLVYAFSVGSLAASGKIPGSGVGGMGVNLENDGVVQRIELTDSPMNRAMIAIRDQFPKGMMQPLMFRIWAMGELMEEPEMAPYIRSDEARPDETEVSDAVFYVAAKMPLNAKMKFAKKQFFQQVAKRFAQNPDLEPIT